MLSGINYMVKRVAEVISNFKLNFIGRLFPNYIIRNCNKILERNDTNLAYEILIKTYKYHKNNYKFNRLLSKVALLQNDWNNAIQYLKCTIKINPSSDAYFNLAVCYQKTDNFNAYKKCIEHLIKTYPEDKDRILDLAQEMVDVRQWESAISVYKQLYEELKEMSMEHLINMSMLYQIIGDYNQADKTFNYTMAKFQSEINADKLGYRKMILFDNGESRIEFYKKLKYVNQVVVTFDSINMVWENDPFSYKFISKKDVDIIAIRKRYKKTYQQDLSQESFVQATETVSDKYADKVAYGFSLGAYNALYYASLINCRILSLSPRLSIHPKYGRKNVIPKYDFKDNISLPYDEKATPLIVYDSKNAVDNTYIQNEVIKQYPNAILIDIKYGSHGMAPHLLRMGQLKEFVESTLDNKIPRYNRKLRVNSNIYYRRLSAECLKHKKYNWALNLVNKSLELLSTDIYAINLKVDILFKRNEYDEALKFIKKIIYEDPKKLRYRILLIRTYIKLNRIEESCKELTKSINDFGNKKSLQNLKKKLISLKEEKSVS